jgi:hypothetical protein
MAKDLYSWLLEQGDMEYTEFERRAKTDEIDTSGLKALQKSNKVTLSLEVVNSVTGNEGADFEVVVKTK